MGKIAIFLGSGASYALAGIPIQKEFLSGVLSEKRAKWLDECGIKLDNRRIKVDKTELSAWMKGTDDVERCLSHFHNMAYSSLSDPDTRAQYKKAIINFRMAIADYIYEKQKIDKRLKNKFKSWLKTFGNKKKIIITTNYDTSVEEILGRNKYYYPAIPASTQRSGVPIYKLHGSINWLEQRNRLKDGELIGMEPLKIHLRQLSGEVTTNKGWRFYKNSGKMYTPIMIPFFFQKEDWLHQRWHCVFGNHWSSALRDLSENKLEEIYFLGCGLPPADHYLLSFLLRFLSKQRQKLKIFISCKGANEPLQKILEPYQPTVYACGLEGFLECHSALR